MRVPQSSIVPPSTLNGGSTSLNRRTSILNRPAKCHTEKSAQWIYRQQTVGQGAPLGEKQVNLFLFAAMRVTVKSFFYDRSGFHKTFFTTHFFTAECFPQKLYQTEMFGIAIRIFFPWLLSKFWILDPEALHLVLFIIIVGAKFL